MEEEDLKNRQEAMINRQLKDRGIKNPLLLQAFKKVKRHLFVPESLQNSAYEDFPLPIGEGQTISQPYIVAYMIEILNLSKTDRVLEIGTGSGYQTAILAELCAEVCSIEIHASHFVKAKQILKSLTYNNIKLCRGDGYKGWPEESPFDKIILSCAPETVPRDLIHQLKDQGELITPLGPHGYQKLVIIRKKKEQIEEHFLLPVLFVPMIHPKD